MNLTRTDLDFARELDRRDELAAFRQEFVIDDPDLIYLDGNSLGRLPQQTAARMEQVIQKEWGRRLIRSWNEGWITAPARLGEKIARLTGAQPDEIIIAESTSVNLFKLAVAALRACPNRPKIVSDVFNFPSDLYIFQGIIDLLGGGRRLELIPSADSVTISPDAVEQAINPETALVSLSHVAFKSAFMYNMAGVTRLAHQAGALVLWDLSHSVGAVPINLNGCHVDLAVGCTYKYLNGGPGAPAFLYVRRDLQPRLTQPIWGWFSAQTPFAFNLDYTPAANISRYSTGTPPVLSMLAVEPALDLVLQAGPERIRAKSICQTEYLIFLADRWLAPLGFSLGSPRQANSRGSHVSLRHPEAYQINLALIHAEPPAVKVIPDFREPDNLRLGIAPLYTTYVDIWRAMDRIRTVAEQQSYRRFSAERGPVT